MNDMNNIGYELEWNAQIENDGPEYVTLPEGDYNFEVVSFERSRYQPSAKAKLPPCNMAVLSLRFDAPEGTTTVKHKLYLHSSVEGLLCAFFTSIGQRHHGERITMNWNAVPGARGRAHLTVRKYTNNKGEERTINDVSRFLEPEEEVASRPATVPSSAPTYQAGRF